MVEDRHDHSDGSELALEENALEAGGPNASRERHWEMLSMALAVIVLSLLLVIRSDGRVALVRLETHPLPETCFSKSMFGIACPACGLTRSFIEIFRGRWRSSLHYHRLGWLMALTVVLQVPYRAACLRLHRPILGARLPQWFGYVLITALIANWLFLPHIS